MIRRRNQTVRVSRRRQHVGDFDKVIGKPFEVAAPAGNHLLSAGKVITARIDEGVIVAHQRAESCDVVRVDAVDKCEDGLLLVIGAPNKFMECGNLLPLW